MDYFQNVGQRWNTDILKTLNVKGLNILKVIGYWFK